MLASTAITCLVAVPILTFLVIGPSGFWRVENDAFSAPFAFALLGFGAIATVTLWLVPEASSAAFKFGLLATAGSMLSAVLLFAYPLHPPGQLDKLRDAHLPDIKVPVLCFNGTRDAFMTPELMEKVLKTVKTRWEMHWLEGADHSFHVNKSSGRTDAQVLDEVADTTRKWVDTLKAS
jgi:pimeloyl-ACP methyl ester carboxylesterase